MALRHRLLIGLTAVFALLAGPTAAKVPIPVPKPVLAIQAVAAGHLATIEKKKIAAPASPEALAPPGISGWMAVDLDTGEVVDQAYADQAFAPASVAKLPTAAYALDMLGPDHRFQTQVLANGPLRNGQIAGDLILQGGGDPELDTDALVPLAEQIRDLGVRSITGALIADGSALPQVREITRAQEVDAAYNPSVSALNLNFNRVHVKWDARKGKGLLSVEAAAARLSPQIDNVRVTLASAPDAPLFSYSEQDGHELWSMARSAYRGRAARWLPVKGPEAYAGEVFRQLAARHGVQLPRPKIEHAPAAAEPLAVVWSRPLGAILRDMLRHSTNLTAEVTGSAATRAAGITAQTLADSAAAMNAWAAQIAGFPAGDPGFQLINHSGLTLDSRLSPRRMVQLLSALALRPGLPSAGLPGGIAPYLHAHAVGDAPAGLQVMAKTGTMSHVRGLAGYAVTPQGRRLAFAIFSNNLAARNGGPERVDRRWLRQAQAFEQAMIRSWVSRVEG